MKKIIFSMIIISGAALLVSCNNWLDVKPQAEVPEKEMFKTESGFKEALTACYVKLNSVNLYGRGLTMREIELLAQHWDGFSSYAGGREMTEAYKAYDYEHTTVETYFKSVYGELYNIIAQANLVLYNLEKRGDVIKTRQLRDIIEGEARALRAFCHMEILRLFGQMPKNPVKTISLAYAETLSLDIAAIPLYNYGAFVDKILYDFNKAEELMKDIDPLFIVSEETGELYKYDEIYMNNDYLSYRRFRFNYYAVQALKARLYMYTGKTAEAKTYANLVINNCGLKLAGKNTDDYAQYYYVLPSECILALSNDAIKVNTSDVSLFSPDSGYYLEEIKLKNDLFTPDMEGANNRYVYTWDTQSATGQGRIRPITKKYQQLATSRVADRMLRLQVIPLVRLSEMYLIAMESESNIGTVNSLYGTYMAARNYTAKTLTENDALDEIVKEYRREFFAEGQMFYVYKRLGYKNMLWRTDEVSEGCYIVPLPKTEINANN